MVARYPQPYSVLLGKYRVESVIGEGGMGAVLKAQHLDLDELVAVKVLLPELMERPEIVQRFLREAKAAVKLKGEHVARVLDVGRLEHEFAGVPYIVMEFLDGADLNAIIRHHGPQDPAVAVDLMLQACQAIAEAHALGIIHRDIKASNFFVTQPHGQAPHLKVLDFGIATAPKGTSDLTNTQSVIGTPAYMAPEQMRTSRSADARSDIWSMGVVLYELLEGARPFRSDVYSELCLKVAMDPPVAMLKAPLELQAIVMKCLEKTVDLRYQSIAELAFDLMPFASDAVLARAAAESCARMLGRRGTRQFDASRAPDDVTPAALNRPTPSRAQYAAVDASETPRSSPRRALTPVPDAPVMKTPTSINASNGQVSVRDLRLAPRRRGLVIAGIAAAGLALGGLVIAGVGGGSKDASRVQPVAAPQAAAEPVKPEPVTAEPVKPAPPEPTAVAPPKPEPVKVEPPRPAKVVPVTKPKLVAKLPPKPVVKVAPKPVKPATATPTPTPPADDVYTRRQ